jgi:hypothetical protein
MICILALGAIIDYTDKNFKSGLGCSSVVECAVSIHKALDSVSTTTHKKKKKEKKLKRQFSCV